MFIEALKCNAVNIILLHNHPSGDSTPSSEEISVMTERIRQCGQITGIKLLDHIVIGDNSSTSFLEEDMICNLEGDEKSGPPKRIYLELI